MSMRVFRITHTPPMSGVVESGCIQAVTPREAACLWATRRPWSSRGGVHKVKCTVDDTPYLVTVTHGPQVSAQVGFGGRRPTKADLLRITSDWATRGGRVDVYAVVPDDDTSTSVRFALCRVDEPQTPYLVWIATAFNDGYVHGDGGDSRTADMAPEELAEYIAGCPTHGDRAAVEKAPPGTPALTAWAIYASAASPLGVIVRQDLAADHLERWPGSMCLGTMADSTFAEAQVFRDYLLSRPGVNHPYFAARGGLLDREGTRGG